MADEDPANEINDECSSTPNEGSKKGIFERDRVKAMKI